MIKRDWLDVAKSIGFIALIILGVWLLWEFMHRPPTAAPSAMSVPAAVAPEVKADPKIDVLIQAKTVKAYSDASKVKLRLPGDVLDNKNIHVIQASSVRADDHPQTVTTVLNTETGESQTFVKEEPLPWLAIDTHGEAGIYLGLKNGEKAARLEVRQGLLQVKAMHVGLIGSADQPISGPMRADYFIGAGAWYRW